MSGAPTRWLRPRTVIVLLVLLALLLLASWWPQSDAGFSDQTSNPENSMQAAESF
jgi:hypothetical protein